MPGLLAPTEFRDLVQVFAGGVKLIHRPLWAVASHGCSPGTVRKIGQQISVRCWVSSGVSSGPMG